jgi:zinc protease
MVVVGATTMAQIKPKLERLFAAWRPGTVPEKNIAAVAPQPKPEVYLLDRPGALQTVLIAGNVAPPKANPEEPAIETMNAVLGSDFGSRLTMNLREDKHWSYGAFSFIRDARGPRPFIAYAPVQTDKTREAIVELQRELRGIVGARPIEPDELARAKASLTLTLPGSWETMAAVAGSIEELVAFGLSDRYFDTYAERVRAQTPASVTAAAQETVQPGHLVWVIVGDRTKIESGVRELNLGEIHLVDADGNALASSGAPGGP